MQTYAAKTKKNAAKQGQQKNHPPAPLASLGNIDLGSSGRNLQLPEVLRERVQSQFGFDPTSIRFKESPEISGTGAKAMAQGDVISFAPGKFDPYTESGQSLIGHELSHIVQQAKGLSSNIKGSNIHYNPASESASDAAGHVFATGGSSQMSAALPVTPVSAASAPVQGLGLGRMLMGAARGIGSGIGQIADMVFGISARADRKNERKMDQVRELRNKLTSNDKYNDFYSDRSMDTPGMDGDNLLKNLEGIQRVKDDFGFKINDLFIDEHEEENAAAFFSAGYYKSNYTVGNRFGFNPKVWNITQNNRRKDVGKRRKDGKYGHNTAGQEYVGIHEAGHAVNAEIMDKLYGIEKMKERKTVGKDPDDYTTESSFFEDNNAKTTASVILRDAVMRLYDTNDKFKKEMQSQVTIDKDDDDDDIREKVRLFAKTDKTLPLESNEGAGIAGVTDIKKTLYDLGYTSRYGMTKSNELYAEAFSDYYSTKDKKAAYEKSWFKRFKKKPAEENPLSEMIIKISKELLDKNDDSKLKDFMAKYGYGQE